MGMGLRLTVQSAAHAPLPLPLWLCFLLWTVWLAAGVHGMTDETIAQLR